MKDLLLNLHHKNNDKNHLRYIYNKKIFVCLDKFKKFDFLMMYYLINKYL